MIRYLAILLILAMAPALAEEDALDYFYQPSLPAAQAEVNETMITLAKSGEIQNAMTLAEQLIKTAASQGEQDPLTLGKLTTNLGVLQTAAGDYEAALTTLARALELLERQGKPFSPELIGSLVTAGLAQLSMNQLDGAEDSFRRAQHLSHRDGGVFDPRQLPIINYLTVMHLRRGKSAAADREQRMLIHVAGKHYGDKSLEMLPVLKQVGHYFVTRGSAISYRAYDLVRLERHKLFSTAIDCYERAIGIIEQHYGMNDLRLLEPLRGLADARTLERSNERKVAAALLRAERIVADNPESSNLDRAKALIDIADAFIVSSDERATSYYLQAWNILQENEQTHLDAEELFAKPRRIYPKEYGSLYLEPRHARPDGEQLYAKMEYTVAVNGRARQIKVLGKNVPKDSLNLMRQRLKISRFRPRLVNGEILATDGLVLNQQFKVKGDARTDWANLKQRTPEQVQLLRLE